MNAKKCIALLLSAVFAVLTLAGCGRADYSALAAKTLNEAQGNRPAVTFETHQKLTSALWAALEEAAQLSDIQQAMTRNNGMQELLTGRYSLAVPCVPRMPPPKSRRRFWMPSRAGGRKDSSAWSNPTAAIMRLC